MYSHLPPNAGGFFMPSRVLTNVTRECQHDTILCKERVVCYASVVAVTFLGDVPNLLEQLHTRRSPLPPTFTTLFGGVLMAGERMVISEYLGCGQFERIVRSAGFFCILKGETMRRFETGVQLVQFTRSQDAWRHARFKP